MSRGLEALKKAVVDCGVIVPTKDVFIGEFDKILCRIVKFGVLNTKVWPAVEAKDGKPAREANNVDQLRIYIHCYSFFSAKEGKILEEHTNKVITLNPNVKWLSEVVALQEALQERFSDADRIFKHKIELWRKDRKVKNADFTFGYIEARDAGADPNYRAGEEDNIQDVDDEDDNMSSNATSSNTQVSNTPSLKDRLVKCSTVEEAYAIVKPLLGSMTVEQRDETLKVYNAAKRDIIMKICVESTDMVETAKTLGAKYYTKYPQEQSDLNEWAISMSSVRTDFPPEDDAPTAEAEDDFPA